MGAGLCRTRTDQAALTSPRRHGAALAEKCHFRSLPPPCITVGLYEGGAGRTGAGGLGGGGGCYDN